MKPMICAVLLAAIALAGCGERDETVDPGAPQPFDLLLDYFPNADHAGIYAAQAGGEFEDLGLDVQIRQPADPAAPIREVAAGRVDLAVSYEPEVFRARDQGLPVVSVAALVGRPLDSIISLPEAGIERPEDLEGKSVGTAGIDYQSAFLQAILAEAGVDPATVEETNVGFNLSPALLTGKVDAILGAFWNYEGVDLRQRGKNPQIIKVDDAGIPTYNELVLVANVDTLEEDGDRIRAFLAALSTGTSELERDPDMAIRGLLDANPDLDPRLQRAVVDETLPLFQPPEGEPYGYQDPAQWTEFGAFMQERGLLESPPDAEAAFTNELLPGAGR